ncbi:MAG: TetR/AcrR family transcriptional regulator, partial [Chloroflexota bacterium]
SGVPCRANDTHTGTARSLIRLLRRKRLAKIQIKEIVEEADVARTTFYQHFETKEQLLFSLIADLFEKIYAEVFQEQADEERFDVLKLLTASYEQWRLHGEELRWVLQVENKDLLIAALRVHIEALKQEADRHMMPDPAFRAYGKYESSFVAGGLYMLIRDWVTNDMRESPETMGKITLVLLGNGFNPFQVQPVVDRKSLQEKPEERPTIMVLLEHEAQ